MQSLLEREGELAAVDELLDRGGALIVEGRAGIGKTALLDATRQRAAGLGHEVLDACGSDLEAGFAFGIVRQLLERRLTRADQTERATLLAGSARAVRSTGGRVEGDPWRFGDHIGHRIAKKRGAAHLLMSRPTR